MKTILYIIVKDWYVWTLRPYPDNWMMYGVWTSYGTGAHRES